MAPPLLEIRGLSVTFERHGLAMPAVRGINLEIAPGQTLGLVGESGSGKSVTALACMGLLPASAKVEAGCFRFGGQDLLTASGSDWRRLRGSGIAMVFQDPMTCLNPLMHCGEQVSEVLRLHRGMNPKQARAEVIDLFGQMGLPEASRRYQAYPHELSGGQRQRVMIAMALAGRPKLLIADEPTTALDVTVQAQILKLLRDVQSHYGMALLLITHDLGIVRDCVERVHVMYAGKVVEAGEVGRVLGLATHPYTRGLLHSIPDPDRPARRLQAIPGVVPAPQSAIAGCRFHPRCSQAEKLAKKIPGRN